MEEYLDELLQAVEAIERGLNNINNIDLWFVQLEDTVQYLGQMFMIIAVVTFVVMAFNFWKVNRKVDNLEEMLEELLEMNEELRMEVRGCERKETTGEHGSKRTRAS